MTRRAIRQYFSIVVWLAIALPSVAISGCDDDDATSPLFTEMFLLSDAPGPIRGGKLVLEYRRVDAGRVWYQLDFPLTTEFGTFRRMDDTIELWMRGTNRRGTIRDKGREIRLNDGTRWKKG